MEDKMDREIPLIDGIQLWSVQEVAGLFDRCNLKSAADAILENQVDGKTLCSLSNEDLYGKVDDGGLGLKPLQLKRIRSELSESLASTCSTADKRKNDSQTWGSRETSMSQQSSETSKAETIYSAQSTGEFDMAAIHCSMDFEGWLNGQLNTMYAQVGTNSGKNIRFEIDVVDDLLPVSLDDALKSVAIYIYERIPEGVELPSDEWFDQVREKLETFQSKCKEALLDEKSRASRATWGSTIKSRYQEQQLQKNRIKAAERAQRRGSGSGLSSQLAS